MEGFPFGGDPEDLMRSLREFAEQQAESVQEAQREQFATLTLNTAVELTSAALQQVSHLHKGGLAAEGGMAVSGRRKREATVPALQPPHGRREGTEYLDLATPRGRPWRW